MRASAMSRRGEVIKKSIRDATYIHMAPEADDWPRTAVGPVETGDALPWVRSLTPGAMCIYVASRINFST